jgi:hypothetical protein
MKNTALLAVLVLVLLVVGFYVFRTIYIWIERRNLRAWVNKRHEAERLDSLRRTKRIKGRVTASQKIHAGISSLPPSFDVTVEFKHKNTSFKAIVSNREVQDLHTNYVKAGAHVVLWYEPENIDNYYFALGYQREKHSGRHDSKEVQIIEGSLSSFIEDASATISDKEVKEFIEERGSNASLRTSRLEGQIISSKPLNLRGVDSQQIEIVVGFVHNQSSIKVHFYRMVRYSYSYCTQPDTKVILWYEPGSMQNIYVCLSYQTEDYGGEVDLNRVAFEMVEGDLEEFIKL